LIAGIGFVTLPGEKVYSIDVQAIRNLPSQVQRRVHKTYESAALGPLILHQIFQTARIALFGSMHEFGRPRLSSQLFKAVDQTCRFSCGVDGSRTVPGPS
jgi:hypothetical protein